MMNRKAICYIVILFVLLMSHAEISGQNNSLASYVLNKDISNNYVSNSYLSSNIVTAIAQDENGMMWFGTKRGLNSFDSYNFEEYDNVDGIINATITDIQPCGDSLFIATEKGLCIYDMKNKSVTNFFAETDSLVLPDNHIFHITKPVKNKITICAKNGTSVYDLTTKKFYIPKNVYIIGTMNTSDRSVGHIDYAIRRRFAFEYIEPRNIKDEELQDGATFDEKLFNSVQKIFDNQTWLSEEFDKRDVAIGHSYFITYDDPTKGMSRDMRIKYEIRPLLEEYIKDGILKKEYGDKQIGEELNSILK